MEQSWWQPATQANNFQISTPAELSAGPSENPPVRMSKRLSLYYSEHPPITGGNVKRLDWLKGCKHKTSFM